jgi:hypothetical protein
MGMGVKHMLGCATLRVTGGFDTQRTRVSRARQFVLVSSN